MDKTVNIALQIIPRGSNKDLYGVIDKAIEVIQQSGLKYKVCPFETVIEGPYDEVMQIVYKAQQACYKEGATDMVAFLKIQSSVVKDVHIEDKTGKYEN